MNKPLPVHFDLAESELAALEHELQALDKRNVLVKRVLILTFFSTIYTGLFVIVMMLRDRHSGASWLTSSAGGILVGWILFVSICNLITVGFVGAFVRGGGLSRSLSTPFLRAPDGRMKRYIALREAEMNYEFWFQRTQEDFWNSLSGTQFELEVLELLTRAGFVGELTAASGDGGVDIVLDDGTIIQCKARRGPCGPAVLRELYGSLHDFGARKAILISREGFTRASLEFAEGKPIDLWDRSTLIALQRGS